MTRRKARRRTWGAPKRARRSRGKTYRQAHTAVIGLATTGVGYCGWKVTLWFQANKEQILHTLAWAVPAAIGLAILLGWMYLGARRSLRERAADKLAAATAGADGAALLALLSGRHDTTGKLAEHACAAALTASGWTRTQVLGQRNIGTVTGGIDVAGYHERFGITALQSKDYDKPVGSEKIQTFRGVCWDAPIAELGGRCADLALFFNTGGFTASARTVAAQPRDVNGVQRTVLLLDLQDLRLLALGQHPTLSTLTRQEA